MSLLTTTKTFTASPTLRRMFDSDAFVRGIRGPVGSGKSVGCCFLLLKLAGLQTPFDGIRRTKAAILRNTYGELRTTTIKTWMDWFGDHTTITYGGPITGKFRGTMKDGTKIEMDLVFVALDRPKDVRKLKSLELSFAWVNEASEISFEVIDSLTGRVDRYPSKVAGGATCPCVIMDTNSCDIENWWYKKAEEEQPEGWAFFDQPAALVRLPTGKYAPNPEAENIENHASGYDYYLRQVQGKTKEWVNVFILNQYGKTTPGAYIYDEFSNENTTDTVFNPGLGHIIWAHDFNFTPLSSAIMQEHNGSTYVVDEIILKSAVARQAAIEFCERYKDHKSCMVQIYGDASGRAGEKHGHPSDYIELEKTLRQAGFRVQMLVPHANPAIKDRQNALRARICDAEGQRRLFVNKSKAPYVFKGLSTVQVKEGSTFQEADSKYQHVTTAVGYYVASKFPVAHVHRTLKTRIG